MPDELTREIETIIEAAREVSLTIVPGTFDDKKLPVVRLETTSASAWKTYLAIVKNLGCCLIVLEKYEFDQGAMEDLRPGQPDAEDAKEFEEGEEAEDDGEFEVKWEKLTLEFAAYYGSLSAFVLYCFREGICYTYEREASWYTKLTDAAEVLKEEVEAAEAEMEEDQIPDLTEKEIEEIAAELARNELFQKAANQNARRFALKKKFPKLLDEHFRQVSEIVDQAKGIFELEIEPEMEKALDTQILDLAKQGLNKEQIAKKLKVSVSRVKKAL
jgi:hypothetical protein